MGKEQQFGVLPGGIGNAHKQIAVAIWLLPISTIQGLSLIHI
jgi:hypothetical protein